MLIIVLLFSMSVYGQEILIDSTIRHSVKIIDANGEQVSSYEETAEGYSWKCKSSGESDVFYLRLIYGLKAENDSLKKEIQISKETVNDLNRTLKRRDGIIIWAVVIGLFLGLMVGYLSAK